MMGVIVSPTSPGPPTSGEGMVLNMVIIKFERPAGLAITMPTVIKTGRPDRRP
ncbi:MAG: hypothetical protein J7598_12240 [Mitsuaria chitosanitabida]|nr:hypothetical protein [Roseateles chitosanitabidus]